MSDQMKVTNISDNSTGWVSRILGAFIIASAIGTAGERVAGALDRNTEAVRAQTETLKIR